jgi:hypothetical protein
MVSAWLPSLGEMMSILEKLRNFLVITVNASASRMGDLAARNGCKECRNLRKTLSRREKNVMSVPLWLTMGSLFCYLGVRCLPQEVQGEHKHMFRTLR